MILRFAVSPFKGSSAKYPWHRPNSDFELNPSSELIDALPARLEQRFRVGLARRLTTPAAVPRSTPLIQAK